LAFPLLSLESPPKTVDGQSLTKIFGGVMNYKHDSKN
jgi:hypothetical protein